MPSTSAFPVGATATVCARSSVLALQASRLCGDLDHHALDAARQRGLCAHPDFDLRPGRYREGPAHPGPRPGRGLPGPLWPAWQGDRLGERRQAGGFETASSLPTTARSPTILGGYVTLERAPAWCTRRRPRRGRLLRRRALWHAERRIRVRQGDGKFIAGTPFFAGMSVWKANPKVDREAGAEGRAAAAYQAEPQLLHCWRHKTPIIYRATTQWFVGMDGDHEPRPCGRPRSSRHRRHASSTRAGARRG